MRKAGLWGLTVGLVGVIGVSSAWADVRTARDAKGGTVSFRPASVTPVTGFEKMSLGADGVLYVSSRLSLINEDIVSATTSEGRAGVTMELALTREAAGRLSANIGRQAGDRLAIFVDNRLLASGEVTLDSASGRTTITGLSSGNVERVSRLLNSGPVVPAGAVIQLVPTRQADGSYQVEVYLEGASGLRTYQVKLQTSGGRSGQLVREAVSIDTGRADYVFADQDVVQAADQTGGRIGGTLYGGAVDAARAYLGTYLFRPTSDAAGVFQISVMGNRDSFLADASSGEVPFNKGAGATITVGPSPRIGE